MSTTWGEPCSLVPFDDYRISLQEAGAQAVPLESLLGVTGRDKVQSFISQHVRPIAEAVQELAGNGVISFMDAGLRWSSNRYQISSV